MKSTYLQEANRRRRFDKMRQITYNKLVGGITIVQCIDAEAVWDTHNKSQELVKTMHYKILHKFILKNCLMFSFCKLYSPFSAVL